MKRKCTYRGHRLRSIEQRQALFYLQLQRFDFRALERFRGR